MSDNDQKEIMKAAIKEWLDEQLAHVGWWFLRTIGVALIAYLLLWYASFKGLKIPM